MIASLAVFEGDELLPSGRMAPIQITIGKRGGPSKPGPPKDMNDNIAAVAVEFTGVVDGEGALSLRIESNQDGAAPFEIELDGVDEDRHVDHGDDEGRADELLKVGGKFVAPHTTSMAALWAVLTRLKRPTPDAYPSSLRDVIAALTPLASDPDA